MYHNVALQPLTGIAVEYLFARFAWAIFSYVTFYSFAPTLRILYIVEDGQSVVKTLEPEQLVPKARSKSRSTSPQKRKASDAHCDARRGRPRQRSPITSTSLSSACSSFNTA